MWNEITLKLSCPEHNGGIYSHVYRFFSNIYCLFSKQRPLKGRFQEYRSVKLSEHNNGKTHFGTILIS